MFLPDEVKFLWKSRWEAASHLLGDEFLCPQYGFCGTRADGGRDAMQE